jgi:hypothetical protein
MRHCVRATRATPGDRQREADTTCDQIGAREVEAVCVRELCALREEAQRGRAWLESVALTVRRRVRDPRGASALGDRR